MSARSENAPRPWYSRIHWPLTVVLCICLALGSLGAHTGVTHAGAARGKSAVAYENANPGTASWQSPELAAGAKRAHARKGDGDEIDQEHTIKYPHGKKGATGAAGAIGAVAPATTPYTPAIISGYAGATSVNHGDPINLYISTARPSYRLEVYRMGYYGGAGGRLMMMVNNLTGQNQPVPPEDPNTGLIECHWNLSYTLQTGADWVSGQYLVKMITDDGNVGYIPFVVRNDTSTAAIVYVVAVTNWQAYNIWGGRDLYDNANSGNPRAYQVSFDRPYDDYAGAGQLFMGDYNMISWVESQGYDVTYATSIDLANNPNLLTGHKMFLSDWHDEYYSASMKNNLIAAANAGVNVAFFASNNMYFQIRLDPSTTGTPSRIITCYKDASIDPMSATNPSLTTVSWRSQPLNEPENAFLGIQYESWYQWGTTFPWVVSDASSWIYNGTGLNNGDSVPGLVGYEYDKVFNNGATPAGLDVISNSPTTRASSLPATPRCISCLTAAAWCSTPAPTPGPGSWTTMPTKRTAPMLACSA